jgi:hypothetical protein
LLIEDDRAAAGAGGRSKFHQTAAVAIVLEVRARNGGKGLALIAVIVPDDGEPVGIAVGHGAKQDAVDDAEDSGVRADAKRERQDGDEREAGALLEDANGKSEVLPERLHRNSLRPAWPKRGISKARFGHEAAKPLSDSGQIQGLSLSVQIVDS